MGFSENTVRFIHRLKLAHDTSAIGACGGLSKGFWPTLPEPCETFVAEIAPVVREIAFRDKCRGCAVGDLGVRVMRPHDSVDIADHDRFDLKRAKLTVTASRMIVSVGFDLNEGREKQWMHDMIRFCGLFVQFARGTDARTPGFQSLDEKILRFSVHRRFIGPRQPPTSFRRWADD